MVFMRVDLLADERRIAQLAIRLRARGVGRQSARDRFVDLDVEVRREFAAPLVVPPGRAETVATT